MYAGTCNTEYRDVMKKKRNAEYPHRTNMIQPKANIARFARTADGEISNIDQKAEACSGIMKTSYKK
jgi:hypothetical protein